MRRPDRRPHAVRLDLFRRHQRKPEWRDLAAEVREKTTRLIARMLRERKAPGRIDRAVGGRDDE